MSHISVGLWHLHCFVALFLLVHGICMCFVAFVFVMAFANHPVPNWSPY